MATNSIEATLHFFVALEKSCQVQLLADAAAAGTGVQTKKVSEAECKITYNVVGTRPGMLLHPAGMELVTSSCRTLSVPIKISP